jgi:hypothetical protein
MTELIGSVFWIIYLSLSVGLVLPAGQDTAKTGVVPSYFGRRSGLAILAGLLPARPSGSLGAATLAEEIVALGTIIDLPCVT